jgi:outer membrane receptor protein involved in Fe transport
MTFFPRLARRFFPGLLIASLIASATAAQSDRGSIAGRVVDPVNGAGVAGATVDVDEQTTTTDIEGRYVLPEVAAGVHTLSVTRAGRMPTKVTGVNVAAGEVTKLDAPLAVPAEPVVKMEAFSVSAEVVQNSGLGLLAARQKAAAVSDAIGSDQMSRLGFGTAASALRAVTGASIVGGKYVYLRGLGERYSNTLVNGVEVPSADPDRRAVNMDMFPSDLIDAIVATKTFTPDRPGNFAGGSVDLKTKEFPDQFTASASLSLGFNSQVTGEPRLTYAAGGRALARDDGTRALPAEVAAARIPPRFSSPDVDSTIGRLSRAFSQTMAPTTSDAPLNVGLGAAAGGVVNVFGRRLGYAASFSYDRSFRGYDGGSTGRYERQGRNSPALAPLLQLADIRSEDEVLLGGLLNLAYEFSPDHQASFNVMANRSGIDVARRQSGLNVSGGGLTETDFFETRSLRYTERSLDSLQLQGRHRIAALRDSRITWSATRATSTQDEPDTRFFSTVRTPDGNYFWEVSGLPRPARYFRELEETRDDFSLDFSLPLRSWAGEGGQAKIGVARSRTERGFDERLYEYASTGARFDGGETAFFRSENVGQLDPATGRFRPGTLYLIDSTIAGNSYDGLQKVDAAYAMIDLPVTRWLRTILGARRESTLIDVRSRDPHRRRGLIDVADMLPSANLVWPVADRMNLRAAWTKTLARPNFREIADYTSFEFVGDFFYVGNPELRRTKIENWDLRWEWFPRRGELVAASVFFKRLSDPIERGVFSVINSGEFQFKNAPHGEVRGFEVEARKRLDFLGEAWGGFTTGANFTWVESKVEITPAELASIRFYEPGAAGTRELAGQSPYVANIDLSWSRLDRATTVSVYYNVFGERLAQVSPPGTPDVFERPVPTLDVTWSQKVVDRWKLGVSVRNLLNAEARETYDYRGVTYDRSRHRNGVTGSLGITWTY